MNQPHDMAAARPRVSTRTLTGIFTGLVRDFREHNVPSPELDARLIICHQAGLTHEVFAAHPENSVSDDVVRDIMDAAKRRCAREPVSRIIGMREFWGLEFALGASSLDPRPDTETLVQAAIDAAAGHGGIEPLSILDIGTGSGCILIALLHELRDARGTGTDRSPETLEIAKANARRHGLGGRASFVCTSWLDGLTGSFDIIVSNPPYIPSQEISSLEPEVARYDPHGALDGGGDGLDAYRWIIPRLAQVLKPGGWALFEVGQNQAPDVCALIQDQGNGNSFMALRQQPDLTGHIRCIAARRSSCL
jgi:release factor glutamine methyltransferase